MTLVSNTSHVAPSLGRIGRGPRILYCLVIAHLSLAGSPSAHEEGSPDYSLWGSSLQQPFPWVPSLGVLPRGTPFIWTGERPSSKNPPHNQPSAEETPVWDLSVDLARPCFTFL